MEDKIKLQHILWEIVSQIAEISAGLPVEWEEDMAKQIGELAE